MAVNPGRGDAFPELDEEPFRSRAIAEALRDEAREKLGDAPPTSPDPALAYFARSAVASHRMREMLAGDPTTWTDRDGHVHVIASMDRRHAACIVRMLERLAPRLHRGACDESLFWPEPNGEQAGYDVEDERNRLLWSGPVEWLDGFALVRALRARAGDTPAGPSRRWLARHPRAAARRALARMRR